MKLSPLLRTYWNKKTAQALWPMVGTFLLIYFTYHAIQGPRGLITYSHLRNEVEQAEALQATLIAERTELGQQVNGLRSEHLSLDLLEERARVVLNKSHPQDLIILLPPAQEDKLNR